MHKIDWYGNDGRSYPDPGTVEAVECGVCGVQMNVERNVLGPTGFAEAMAGRSHRHDRFTCPHVEADWHKRIYRLKNYVLDSVTETSEPVDYEEKKRATEKEIIEILEAHAVR